MRFSKRRFTGELIARGTVAGRMLRQSDRFAWTRARRAFVKVQLVRFGRNGVAGLRAHLNYIVRDGTSRDGEPARLYSRVEQVPDGKLFLEQSKKDRHYFRVMVSADDGLQYDDLRPLIRRFMGRVEDDLGTKLDWVAADHLNTFHPHTHIVLRGKDGTGDDLIIAPDYMHYGMRARAGELISVDLGPKTELEINQQLHLEVHPERFTSIDRRLVLQTDSDGVVSPTSTSTFDHVIEVGRLRKLYALGLAEPLENGRWRLRGGLEEALEGLRARAEKMRTMQRALSAAGIERSPSECVIEEAEPRAVVTGKIMSRGFAPADHSYLVVDGIDGRCHYVPSGKSETPELPWQGAIVRISAAAAKETDTTPGRKNWINIELLSRIPLEQLPQYDGVTWLDSELVAPRDIPRDAGFGREVRTALAARRSWLVEQGLASMQGSHFACHAQMLRTLERRELSVTALRISNETGLEFSACREDRTVEGILRRKVDGASRAFALIENQRDFSLVPWRGEFESLMGQQIWGIVRADAVSWAPLRRRGPEI